MVTQIDLGGLVVDVVKKDIKNIHLSVHPPIGKVKIAAPLRMDTDTIRVFAITKLDWIKKQQKKMREQSRESPREYLDRESHYLWGRRYLLKVVELDRKPCVTVQGKRITLAVRPGSDVAIRAAIMHEWHKALLHEAIPPLIAKWQPKLKVQVAGYFLQRMKTKWGSCNHHAGNIRLNTELVKKPKELLEYVIVHEMAHLREPTHNDRFTTLLARHIPAWRDARNYLNDLPLSAEDWK